MNVMWRSSLLGLLFILFFVSSVPAALKSFSAGSLILPVDPCWQPEEENPAGTGCAAGGSRESAAGVFGLVYRLQRAGVPVYQVAPAPQGGNGFSLLVNGGAMAPVSAFPGDRPLDPPARSSSGFSLVRHLIDYRQPPFLVEARALDADALAVLAEFPRVRRHRALVPFSAMIDRLLTGLPQRVSALTVTAAEVLTELLAGAGLNDGYGLSVVSPDPLRPAPADSASARCAPDRQSSAGGGFCSLPDLFADLCAVSTTTPPRETVGTSPLVSAGILYAASAEFPGHTGHLRAFTLNGRTPVKLWDAATEVAVAGSATVPSAIPPAPDFHGELAERRLFTDLGSERGYRPVLLHAVAAAELRSQLATASVIETTAIINALRGRTGVTTSSPAGNGERANRLGAISRSSPALVDNLPPGSFARARTLYVGSEDGLLHAISAADGRELWGYLPGGLLPYLPEQPFFDPTRSPAIHVDGSPAVANLFVDTNGDGRREWRTLLAGTACVETLNRGLIFVLDVTDAQEPRVLWEGSPAGDGFGCSRGGTIGGPLTEPQLFLTAATSRRLAPDNAPDPVNGRGGLVACALSLQDGRLLWQSTVVNPFAAGSLDHPPTPPVLMNAASIGGIDAVVFGDVAGRLWALDQESGLPVGAAPVWQVPAGAGEPIGGGVAVHGRLALFGTGGVAHADDNGQYAIYAVELGAEGSRLLWRYALAAGEQSRGTPSFDRFGQVYVGVGREPEGADTVAGRLLVLAEGALAGDVPLAAAPAGTPAIVPGAIITVARDGQVDLVGEPLTEEVGSSEPARVRVLSWRVR